MSNRRLAVADIDPTVEHALRERIADLSTWLSEHGGGCQETQAHLDAGSVERTYWHYGYLIALRDVMRLIASHEVELQ